MEFAEISEFAYSKLQNGDYAEAKVFINEKIAEFEAPSNDEEYNFSVLANLYGFLIDLGYQTFDKESLETAIIFFESNESKLLELAPPSTYYYNLANAKHGLARVFINEKRCVPNLETVKKILQAPINLYWIAFKYAKQEQNDLTRHQIMINLSNSLSNVARHVEAQQFLDSVLINDPTFPEALISRADNLLWMTRITNCPLSIAHYAEVYKSYKSGLLAPNIPEDIETSTKLKLAEVIYIIESNGFTLTNIDSELAISKAEQNNHSEARRFSIENFLTLNEHTIYCGCRVSELDDLQIGVPHGSFQTPVLPKLELLLNRMKSEFALARWHYFQHDNADFNIDYDARFTELMDNEIINAKSELLRTSFRICYGILDKIAHGICKLYNLDSKRVYFETFWEQPTRWNILNNTRNLHLSALYSIANNLSPKGGELREFRDWRNKLEHNILILKDNSHYHSDPLQVYEDEEFITVVDINEFRTKTLHLLQLTRAAIFSFVYCVRLQTIERLDDSNSRSTITISFKNNDTKSNS